MQLVSIMSMEQIFKLKSHCPQYVVFFFFFLKKIFNIYFKINHRLLHPTYATIKLVIEMNN